MPTYDYACGSCGKRFSLTESIAAHGRQRLSCPACKSQRVDRLYSVFYAKTIRKS